MSEVHTILTQLFSGSFEMHPELFYLATLTPLTLSLTAYLTTQYDTSLQMLLRI